jgi:FHA domain/Protein of unknown function (DUF3662)
MSVLDKVRSWIDGDSAELVLEDAARDAQIKPRSVNEEYIVKIARSVEEVMQREMVPLPQGTTLIPTEYIIFLSEEDDKEWQGVKRRGLEQGLYHILAERAKEISGKKKLGTQSFAVELRVDGTLEKGDIRVQHSWDDTPSGKTGVLARPKIPETAAPRPAHPVRPSPDFNSPHEAPPPTMPQMNVADLAQPGPFQPPPTRVETGPGPSVPFTGAEPQEEMTHVRKRTNELYKLEIWRGGVRQSVVPIFQNAVSIGRGSKSKPVDIPLAGDPEISRRHLTLTRDEGGNYWINSEGRNPVTVNNFEVPMGQRAAVTPGVPIVICSYLLRVQPK